MLLGGWVPHIKPLQKSPLTCQLSLSSWCVPQRNFSMLNVSE